MTAGLIFKITEEDRLQLQSAYNARLPTNDPEPHSLTLPLRQLGRPSMKEYSLLASILPSGEKLCMLGSGKHSEPSSAIMCLMPE